MVIGGLGAGVIGGALGGGLAVTVLAPLTAANNFLGSYFFGSGMILGERQMYQDDWIKIKKRLDAGESFLVILEEVMKPNTQAVMQMARETVIAVSAEWNDIVLKYLQSIPQSIWDALNKINAGEATDNPFPLGDGIIGIINGVVSCAAGYTPSTDRKSCIKNTTIFNAPPTVTTQPEPPRPEPTPGTQVPINKVPATYNVSTAALKLYAQMQGDLEKLNATRNVYLTSQDPSIINNRKALLKSVDSLRANKFNQISVLEKSYPKINAAWKAAYF